MKKKPLLIVLVLLVNLTAFTQEKDKVFLKVQEDTERVDVYIEGRFFTAYRFDSSLDKPVLYPIFTADGEIVTRGYPLDPREKERVDHPHHVGLWFNFGDVNGYDFWNNSSAVPREMKGNYGKIIHRTVGLAETQGEKGILKVKMDWVAPDTGFPETLLTESTTFIFKGSEGVRIVDRITTLTAVSQQVEFTDNKEGLLAIRVDRAFELPSEEAVALTDGWYNSSEGAEGGDVWGKRARWVKLRGTKNGKAYSLILMDHPQNLNYPSCWHARGYGLFSVNNMGRRVFDKDLEKFHMVLNHGDSLSFRHRFVVAGGDLTTGEVERLFSEFSSE